MNYCIYGQTHLTFSRASPFTLKERQSTVINSGYTSKLGLTVERSGMVFLFF